MLKKIKVLGQGGQGVKYLTSIMGKLIDKLDYSISLVLNYDSAVRGGSITADLIVSNSIIKSPIIDNTNVVIDMENNTIKKGKVSNDMSSLIKKAKSDFTDLQENMFYLGCLMKILNLSFKKNQLEQVLKKRYLKDNLKSIELGYKLY